MKPKAPHANCEECPLKDRPFAGGDGPKKAEYVVVGEAPGRNEVRQGKPFVGQAGKLLNMILKSQGIKREDVYATNAVLCRPPLKGGTNTPPNKKAMDCCHERLVREISKRQPRRIIATGTVAAKSLLRTNQGITDLRIGGPKEWPNGSAEVVPTFHPAAALRNPDLFPQIITDLRKVTRVEVGWEPTKYKVVDDVERAVRVIAKQCSLRTNRLALDVEVDHLSESHSRDNPDWLCIGISHRPGGAVVYPERVVKSRRFQRALREQLARRELTWCYQNGKFDTQLLWSFAPEARVGEDSMLLHYVTNEIKGTHDLEQLMTEFLDAPAYKTETRKHLPRKGASLRHLPPDLLHYYNATDTDGCHRLIDPLTELAEKDGVLRPYRELLIPASYSFGLMERHGILLDVPYLRDDIGDEILELANRREERILDLIAPHKDEIVGYNDNFARSHQQIKQAFKIAYGIDLPNTEELTLEPLVKKGNDMAEAILSYRKVQKLFSTYVRGPLSRLDADRRLRVEFKLHGTETGRTSTSPNIQNWPMPEPDNPSAYNVRNAVVAPKGRTLLSMDYAGIELVVAAYLSGDENLLTFIREGRSFHRMVAGEVFGADYSKREYRDTKAINFGTLFAETPQHLAFRLGCSLRKAKQIQRTFFERAPKIKNYHRETARAVVEDGELTSIFERKRRFWLITRENQKHLIKEGHNFPIQSAAHDFTLDSLNRIVAHYDIRPDITPEVMPIIEMHDDLTFEVTDQSVEDAARDMKKIMEDTCISDVVPTKIEAKVGRGWGSGEEIDVG